MNLRDLETFRRTELYWRWANGEYSDFVDRLVCRILGIGYHSPFEDRCPHG
jgi:hypothetical protein